MLSVRFWSEIEHAEVSKHTICRKQSQTFRKMRVSILKRLEDYYYYSQLIIIWPFLFEGVNVRLEISQLWDPSKIIDWADDL